MNIAQVVVRNASPGCSFVWEPTTREVRDVRLYIDAAAGRGIGWGYLIVSFVQAFFFPFVTDDPDERGLIHLPLGGARNVERMSTLPTQHEAKAFYRRQGFRAVRHRNKWILEPQIVQELLSTPLVNDVAAAVHVYESVPIDNK